jgi:lactate permease
MLRIAFRRSVFEFAMWAQNYNPTGSALVSTLLAALPAGVLLGAIVGLRMRIHRAALLGLAVAAVIAVGIFHMPPHLAVASALFGGAFGLFPVGWMILNLIFLYHLTVRRGHFKVLRESLGVLAPDPRIQLILVAFAFGAFLEGLAGFGAPVAITAAILLQLGFRPLSAAGLALIANTAPVAFGSVGIPIVTLEQVTGLSARLVSMMVGRQLPFFSLLIPFWIVLAFVGWRGLKGVWPAALTAGVAFAVPQFLVSNLHGPWLVDIISGGAAIGALVLLLRFWRPAVVWGFDAAGNPGPIGAAPAPESAPASAARAAAADADGETRKAGSVLQAWLPWVILTVFIFAWGMPQLSRGLDQVFTAKVAAPYLHQAVRRVPPVAPVNATPEAAVFNLNLLSATGTGILAAALIAGLGMGFSAREMLGTYGRTLWDIRLSLVTIAAMLALGNVTKYSGTDATLGLALARTGHLYPFFGTLLGWFGVAMTGSDTASNVLFGGLQKITAQQAGVSPILMGAANSSGGVMGKMMAAQSVVIASTATNLYGQEFRILRFVIWHSIALVVLMGLLVYLQAYVAPFTAMVPK